MPLYLCLPGHDQPEPWRHGMSVYAAPYPITENAAEDTTASDAGQNRRPLRRLRHGEVVLVDDVCVMANETTVWLRLRWPGRKAGFAGYVPLLDPLEPSRTTDDTTSPSKLSGQLVRIEESNTNPPGTSQDRTGTGTTDEADLLEDPTREETASMPSADPAATIPHQYWTSLRNGLAFPTSTQLQCLAVYDDGITPPVAIYPSTAEPVFCRICREGLHEDADQEQPEAENDEGTENRGGSGSGTVTPTTDRRHGTVTTSTRPTASTSRQSSNDDMLVEGDDDTEINLLDGPAVVGQVDPNDPTVRVAEPPLLDTNSKGPVLPHPLYAANPHAMENPIMAPCDCAGSMAFVHYLCVEEWRCRSRHPAAQNGLHCETCGAAYRLPPPTSRPARVNPMDDEMMMDAMPAHVMQALRQPHIWWQIGASIVRRRWLRPLAPVLMSPIVSLYCRARRMLKKRGVARRRWACSLCRRRARWKCVRCLRSYYCSRQCQNVSWHIVHKHLCYKPVRALWSWIVYGSMAILLCPGIIRDPLLYDMGMLFIPASFVVCGVVAGSFATLLKKTVGYDIRGRFLEGVVLVTTIGMSLLSWGLAQAFFGEPGSCYGMLGPMTVTPEMYEKSLILQAAKFSILDPTQWYYALWDRAFSSSGSWIQALVCSPDAAGCFPHVPPTTVDFYMQDGACASDWFFFLYLYTFAFGAFGASTLYKAHERQARQRQRNMQNHEMRLRRRAMAGLRADGAARPHMD